MALERLEDRTVPSGLVSISIGDASITEGDAGTSNLTFTVTRTGDTTSAVTVRYSTADDSATAGLDYASIISGTVTIAAGETTATIDVPITGDMLVEGNENFFVNLIDSTAPPSTFAPQQDFSTDARPRAVSIGDLNGDGKPDLTFAMPNFDKVSVFLNTTPTGTSTATFGVKQDFTVGDRPYSVRVGDLNGDGKPDLAVTNFDSNNVTVLINTTAPGSATAAFAAKQDFATQANPYFVSIADLNGDGNPDLTVANQGSGSVSVLLNQTAPGSTTPSFSGKFDFTTAPNPDSASIGDFNGDGKPDIATANAFNDQISVLLNTTATGSTTPTFTQHQDFALFDGAFCTAIGDVNGDGKVDLAVANRDAHTVSVLLNTTPAGGATFSFGDRQDFAVGTSPHSISIRDLNSDGKLDLAVPNFSTSTISVLINQTVPGAATSSFVPQDFATGITPLYAEIADLNGDYRPDLVSVNLDAGTFSVLLNTITTPGPDLILTNGETFGAADNPVCVVIKDLNGDGKPDIATGGHGGSGDVDGTVSVLLNTSTPGTGAVSFAAKQDFSTSSRIRSLAVGDINLDGKADLVVGHAYAGAISVLLNTTPAGSMTTSFAASPDLGTYRYPHSIVVADMNGDGRPDLVVANHFSKSMSILLNTTTPGAMTSSFAAKQNFPTAVNLSSVAVGELNGDGMPDIAISIAGGVSVLLNTTVPGNTVMSFAANEDFSAGSHSVSIEDINGDGRPDLATVDNFNETISVLLNTTAPGAAIPSFTARLEFAIGEAETEAGEVGTLFGDFNGDGKPDVALSTSAMQTVAVLVNTTTPGSATPNFAAVQHFNTGASTQGVVFGDLNGDGRIDVVATNNEPNVLENSVTVLLNSSASFADNQAIGTILNDDIGPSPLVDLNGVDGAGTGFTRSFIEDSSAVNLTDSDATIADPDGTELVNLKLVVSAIPDGVKEVLTVAGVVVPLNANKTGTGVAGGTTFQVSYVASTRTLSVTRNGGGSAPIADFQDLLRGITYSNASDAPNTTSRTINITANDSTSDSLIATATITITATNDPPTDINLSTSSIAENQPAGTVVGTLSTVDPDNGSTFTYALVPGAGDTDNASFTIVNGQLRAAAGFDFETKSSYTVRIRSTDQGGLTVEKQFTITVTNANDAPTDIVLSAMSIPENQPSGTVVGTLSSIDQDLGDTFTYSLVPGAGGTDNSAFTIVNGQLRSAGSFNFEGKNSYSIRVRTADPGGLTFEKPFTVTVTDANDAPTDLALSVLSVVENQPAGTTVGTFSSTDPDLGNSFTYSLMPGTGSADNISFTIVNGQLRTAASFNFESKSSLAIRVRSTDQGGLSLEKQLTITVSDINEAPTDIVLLPASISENQPPGASVGTLGSVDPDSSNSFTYSFAPGGTDNASFAIVSSQLFTAASFDFESKANYTIRIRTTDQGGLTFEKQISIAVNDINESPTDVGLSTTSVAENQPSGAVVGAFSSTDPDAGNIFTYSLVPGAGSIDNASFTVLNGQLRTGGSIDFETKNSYSIRVRSVDQGGQLFEKQFTITVNDANDAPTNLALSTTAIAENQAAGSIVGTFNSTDQDIGNTFSYSLVTGTGSTDNASFSIANGQLRTAASLNFETKNSYSIRVRSTDQGGLTFDRQITISITDVNESPTGINLSVTSVAENQPGGTAVGTFSSTDPDVGSTFNYSLVAGAGDTDNGGFTISNGQLLTVTGLDFETKSSYAVRVRTTDQGGQSFEKIFAVNVTDVNEVPVIAPDQSFNIAENLAVNGFVATVIATDQDSTAPFNSRIFSITAGNSGNAFTIDPSTGQLTVNNPVVLNFEATPLFSLVIALSDGAGASATPTLVTIHLVDVNEMPTITPINVQSIPEDGETGTISFDVGDSETPVTQLIVQATSSNQGLISNASLIVTGAGAGRGLAVKPLSDQSGTATITVSVSDGVNLGTRSFVVTVAANNDAPFLSSFPSQTILEDKSIEQATFTIGDVDSAIGSLTVTAVSSNDSLVPNLGIVLGGAGANRSLTALVAANQSGIAVITITVSDGALATSQQFQITVNPVDDLPVILVNPQPLVYPISSKKILAVDGAAAVTDIDTLDPNFNGYVLKVSGHSAKDQLSILNQGSILRKGKVVRFTGAVIGTLEGGKKGTPLTIKLNSDATQTAVRALLRAIGFKSIDKIPGNRMLELQLTSIDGANPVSAIRQIQVGP